MQSPPPTPSSSHPFPPLLEGESLLQAQKMISGQDYLASDPYLSRVRANGLKASEDLDKYDTCEARQPAFADLVVCLDKDGKRGKGEMVFVGSGFVCEYVSV